MASLQTQESLLAAAAEVFSENGFSGARVDEIARRAKANKAMIYYHFRSKDKLYEAVLLRIFGSVHDALESVARAEADPHRRLVGLYRALADFFGRQPAYPRLILREMLAGGRHMDPSASRALGRVFVVVRDVIEEGIRQGAFRPVPPHMVHLNVMGTLLVYMVSIPFRQRVRAAIPQILPQPDSADDVLRYLDDVLARTLRPDPGEELTRSQP
jgi:TetR/AcrR family transcriptional regulator